MIKQYLFLMVLGALVAPLAVDMVYTAIDGQLTMMELQLENLKP